MNQTKNRTFWISWLQIVLALVCAYGLLLVLAGHIAGTLFDALGFGPPVDISSVELRDYLKLPFMVLGAVMLGWSCLMLLVVRGPLRRGEDWAITMLAQSIGLWFILDTSMSLVLGYATHALFNIPFVLALGIPLFMLRRHGSMSASTMTA